MRDRRLTPRPGLPRQEFDPDVSVLQKVDDLEERVENGESELKKFRESYEGFKKVYGEDRVEVKTALVRLATEAKAIKWMLGLLVAIGILSGILNFLKQ